MDVPELAPLRGELAAVPAASRGGAFFGRVRRGGPRVVAVGEEEDALGRPRRRRRRRRARRGAIVEHLAARVVRAEEGVVVRVRVRVFARRGRGRLHRADLRPEPLDALRAAEVGEILDPPRARHAQALVHVHALARAQAARGVVHAARLARGEEHHRLLVARGGDDAAPERALRALHRDVEVRARGGGGGGTGDGRGDGGRRARQHRGARVDEEHDPLAVRRLGRERSAGGGRGVSERRGGVVDGIWAPPSDGTRPEEGRDERRPADEPRGSRRHRPRPSPPRLAVAPKRSAL